ncbi:hypothetical protein KO561_05755 [Radiobacillus kanasensis]|nr:hypothetical protein [Radiobacillus kanasensis]UFU00445.1 hypothetical protein KO561_05755 [Radiobacillus kanasensis]
MKEKKEDQSYKKSYESDGIIGKDRNAKEKKANVEEDDQLFFNITEGSE